MEIGERIVLVGKCRAQSGDIELGGDEISLEMILLSRCHGGSSSIRLSPARTWTQQQR
jgi:hypothetical protein